MMLALALVADTIRIAVGSPAVNASFMEPHRARVIVERQVGSSWEVSAEWINELTVGDSAGKRVQRWVTTGTRQQPGGGQIKWQIFQTYDRFEEALEDGQAVAVPNPGEAGMVGQRLPEVIAQVPAQTEAVRHHAHELAFRAESLEEENELELEENDRVNRRTPRAGIAIPDESTDEGEVERVFQVAVELVLGEERIQANTNLGRKGPFFAPHHGGPLQPWSLNRNR